MEQEREPEVNVDVEPPAEADTSELDDPLTDLLLGIDAKLDHQNALLQAELDNRGVQVNADTSEQNGTEAGETADVSGHETRAGSGAESGDASAQSGGEISSLESQSEREPDHEPDSGNWYYRKRFTRE